MTTVFEVDKVREQFPILTRKVGKYPLVYFDNGATSEKPLCVIDRIDRYYREENANVHRGVHYLSQLSTDNYEKAREAVRKHINAKHGREVILTSGTTDSINLVAHSFGRLMNPGDEVLITEMEHHSNIVPWQLLASERGVEVKYIPLKENGELDLSTIDNLLTKKTRLLSVVHISNSLGTINPIRQLIKKAHAVGAKVLIDAAQSLQHTKVDVQELDCDFLAFSGHKVFGPTGVGVLYGKEEILNEMPPYRGGGEMIKTVTMERTTFNELPHKFEAGTPNIAGVIGLGTALEWLDGLDREAIEYYEKDLLAYATERLLTVDGARIYGTAAEKSSILSFLVEGTHPYDIGTLLNQQGIAVRTGHHCTQPVMDHFGVPGTVRASFSFYNTREEIEIFIQALERAVNMLR